MAAAAEWLSGLATGSIAMSLCVIAIAVLGMQMLAGRIPIRAGVQVVLGCFILLGAPTLASAFLALGEQAAGPAIPSPVIRGPGGRAPLPQSTYDPYAGASVRQD